MSATAARSETVSRLREQHVARGIATATNIVAARAQGSTIWDVDQKEYLDFAGGIGVLNVGHGHPRVVEAVQAQLERFTHTCYQVAPYEQYVRLAERLNAMAPGSFPKKSLLVTTGAEAVENGIKIARAYTGRRGIIAFNGAFHGRTLLGMSLTGKHHPYRAGFGPFAPEIYHAPYPNEYRGWSVEQSLQALDELFTTQIAADEVAGIIIEPVLGEGGFVPAPTAFLEALQTIANRHGIVLIADEIQTGFGRTGRWLAVEHSGIEPDLILVAKSLAGGLPLAGVIGRAEIMDAPEPGGLGGTYAGNPLACAAALGVFQAFADDNLLDEAQRVGEHIRRRLQSMYERFSCVGEVRGLGAMQALEFVRNRETREPWPALVDKAVADAEKRGLIALKAGLYGNVIRLLPPLNTTEEQIDKACDILEASVHAALGAVEGQTA